ncbi:coiled-coil domain-containing protein 146 isoform X1 [Erythrolamprus reginae]|uniref:coiled-coil domain-containing protein 146 isoform X1 n=1 Tax=Erythrolamprus reginae TaxID=121349 RepID=UPI00396C7447
MEGSEEEKISNSSESEGEYDADEEEGEEESGSEPENPEDLVYAMAPTVNIQDESAIDVESCPAFVYINQLFYEGKIPGTRLAQLKANYALLHDTLVSLQESEIQLLQDAKRFTVILEEQQQELEKAEEFPDSATSEVSKLRQQYLRYFNEYNAIQEREFETQYRLSSLIEDKKLIEKDYRRIPKASDADKKIRALRDSCEDLRKETTQRRLEIKNLKDDLFTRHKRLTRDHKELEELFRKQEELKDELVRLQAIPIQLGKDMEKISRRIQEIEKKKISLREEAQESVETSKKMETKCVEAMEEKDDAIKEVEGKKALLEIKEREFSTQTKVHEMNKENEGTAISERGLLEMSFRNMTNLKQKLHDTLCRMQREKEKDIRTFKKMEMQLKIAQEGLVQVQAHHERMLLELDGVPKGDGAVFERRRELQREVEIAKRNLSQEKASTDSEVRVLEQCIAEENQLIAAQEHYREDLNNLIRMTQLKADEREQKSKDFLKAQVRLNNIMAEIKTKDFEIRERTKKQREIHKQMKEFAKLYDIVRHERNKLVNLVHSARQKTNEIKDKVKMLDNEMEILRNNAVIKERKLQKYQLKYSNKVAIKDSIQSDVSKVCQIVQDMKEKREQQLMNVERLTNTLTRIEEEMVQLRKTYEKAVQRRNESGVQLIEREEEVCIFYEKINIQEMMSRNGDIEINVMDEKIRYLKLKMIEKKRQIELSIKMLPTKRTLDADLVVLQIQFSQCKDKIKSLEKLFTDPDRENRVRALPGKDPSIQELFKKIEELEIQLTRREERLLEKDFVYEQVTRMIEKVSVKAENGREETLILAKKMNVMQEKIKSTTQKIMALIAELSMHQAFAIRLQQEMRDKEQTILCIVSRLAKGLPPPKEIEQDWLRVLRDERMHEIASEARAKQALEQEQAALPTAIHTTAEQRPNAYIPDDENVLPLPRPYGSLAPFKPSEPSANMRHIRKPIVKPIEI